MSSTTSRLGAHLMIASVPKLVLFLAVSAYVALAGPSLVAPSVPSVPSIADRLAQVPADVTWQPSYADRFPGCVSSRAWERVAGSPIPGALVVVRRSGRTQQMGLEAVVRRGRSGNRADDVWVVGACA